VSVSTTNRESGDFFSQFADASHVGGASGEDDAEGQQSIHARSNDSLLDHVEEFFQAGFDDVGEDTAVEFFGASSTLKRDVDGFIVTDKAGFGATVADLDAFGFESRSTEAESDVVADVITTDGQDGGVHNASIGHEHEVSGSSADVNENDSHFPLVLCQHSFGRGKAVEVDAATGEIAHLKAGHDVLEIGGGRGDEMSLDFKAIAAQAKRFLNPLLLVYGVVLRQEMKDLTVLIETDGTSAFKNAFDVRLSNLVVSEGDTTAIVFSLNVTTGDIGHYLTDVTTSHHLGFFDCLLNGSRSFLEVCDDSLGDTVGGCASDANDVKGLFIVAFTDYDTDFVGPNIKTNEQFVSFLT
jgi:hypothetical protein